MALAVVLRSSGTSSCFALRPPVSWRLPAGGATCDFLLWFTLSFIEFTLRVMESIQMAAGLHFFLFADLMAMLTDRDFLWPVIDAIIKVIRITRTMQQDESSLWKVLWCMVETSNWISWGIVSSSSLEDFHAFTFLSRKWDFHLLSYVIEHIKVGPKALPDPLQMA